MTLFQYTTLPFLLTQPLPSLFLTVTRRFLPRSNAMELVAMPPASSCYLPPSPTPPRPPGPVLSMTRCWAANILPSLIQGWAAKIQKPLSMAVCGGVLTSSRSPTSTRERVATAGRAHPGACGQARWTSGSRGCCGGVMVGGSRESTVTMLRSVPRWSSSI